MKVSEHVNDAILECLLNHFFGGHDLGRLVRWIRPLPVEVEAAETTSLIAIHHAIGVQHGNYLENEIVPQELCSLIVFLQEEINRSFHHKRANCLARMRPRREYYCLSLGYFALLAAKIGDDQLGAVIASCALAKHATPHEVAILLRADASV